MEWRNGKYILTDERARVNVDTVHGMLRGTYWAYNRSRDVVEKTIENSLCFSLMLKKRQIGFARVVSDCAVFSYIADVIIEPEFRGRGLGKWMMECVMEHPDIRDTQQLLQTADAHEFYEKLGFGMCECMNRRPAHLTLGPPEP